MPIFLSDEVINIIRVNLIKIFEGILYTSNADNITVHGNPLLVEGPEGGFSVELNGIDQYLQYPYPFEGCLGNLSLCPSGVTIQFSLKFVTLTDNTIIISNGGEREDSAGFALYYLNHQIVLMVSTQEREWTVSLPFNKLDEFIDFEFSWSWSAGLTLSVDDTVVKSNTWRAKVVTKLIQYSMTIGRSVDMTQTLHANVVWGGWNIFLATREVLDILDVNTGNSTMSCLS